MYPDGGGCKQMAWGPWDGNTVLILIICIVVAVSSGVFLNLRKQNNRQNDNTKSSNGR